MRYLHNPTADDLASAQRWAATHRPNLVVLDGMAESMAAEGLIEDKAGDVINYLRDRMRPFPAMIGNCGCGPQAAWLREEVAALGHPLALRIRHSQLQSELLRIQLVIGEQMRAALDAAAQLVTRAAGGTDAVPAVPFVRVLLEELARYRSGPTLPATPKSRQTHLRATWMAIDAAVAAVPEIQFDARQRTSP